MTWQTALILGVLLDIINQELLYKNIMLLYQSYWYIVILSFLIIFNRISMRGISVNSYLTSMKTMLRIFTIAYPFLVQNIYKTIMVYILQYV